MSVLLIGLIVFLGVHSVRIVAEGWRLRAIERWGAGAWRGAYSVLSLVGLGLIVWGYVLARQSVAPPWWNAPVAFKHLNSLFTLAAFVLLAAAYVPRNQIKAWLHHPMVIGIALWALGHLLATGRAANVLLFGAFLCWALADLWAARRRDRTLAIAYPPGRLGASLLAVAVGVVAWAVFARWLHAAWIGVVPM